MSGQLFKKELNERPQKPKGLVWNERLVTTLSLDERTSAKNTLIFGSLLVSQVIEYDFFAQTIFKSFERGVSNVFLRKYHFNSKFCLKFV